MGGGTLGGGAKLGRYVLLEQVGEGGMGVVYAAYDPELERTVALKVLHAAKLTGANVGHAQARLIREAQAMASLSHPNVIPVYDVGVIDAQVFVAMEFVDGSTLSVWARDQKRSWRAKVDVLVKAGRGLAAAHAGGFVHRDFKPSNVLVGKDGRVRVLDFGVAGLAAQVEGASAAAPAPTAMQGERLTEDGTVMGTPAYMAPEQHRGETMDHRGDQFGFCVTAWEILFGKRPFADLSNTGLYRSKVAQNPEIPEDSDVPAWVRRALIRGLARDADARWPSMGKLLDTLSGNPAARRRKLLSAAGALVVTVGTIVAVAERGAQTCRDDAKLDGIWDAARRASVRTAFQSTELPYAADSFASVAGEIDRYASEWADGYRQTCDEVGLAGLGTDLKLVCLRRRSTELRALIDVLEDANESSVENAVQAAASLRPITPCYDIDQLESGIELPPDAATAERVQSLRERLALAEAYHRSSRLEDALAAAQAIVNESEQVGYDPLEAEALHLLAKIQEKRSEYGPAEEAAFGSYLLASSTHQNEIAAETATDLIFVIGVRGERHDEGHMWAKHARAAIARAGNRTRHHAQLHRYVGSLAEATDENELAAEHMLRSLELWETAVGKEHVSFARALSKVAGILYRLGRYEDASERWSHALEIAEKVYGPDHPFTASLLGSLSVGLHKTGDLEDAAANQERSLEILTNKLGRNHAGTAAGQLNLSQIRLAQGRYDEAERLNLEGLRALQVTLGDAHPTAAAYASLGGIARSRKRYAEALAYYQRALSIQDRALGPTHSRVARTIYNTGNLHDELDDHEAALEQHLRALEIWQAAQSNTHELVARATGSVGDDYFHLGDAARAAPYLERSVFLFEHAEAPLQLAMARLSLARVMWTLGHRPRARRLAQRAYPTLMSLQRPVSADDVAEYQAWMDEHGIERAPSAASVAVSE